MVRAESWQTIINVQYNFVRWHAKDSTLMGSGRKPSTITDQVSHTEGNTLHINLDGDPLSQDDLNEVAREEAHTTCNKTVQ